jgi:hypothetical protein
MKLRLMFAPIFLIGILSSGAAMAIPLTWTLQNVLFDDGGAANGSYSFDADTTTYSSIAVNTTAGTALGAQSYTLLRPGSGGLDFGFTIIDVIEADMTNNRHVAMVLVGSMTNAGGTINFGNNGTFDPWEGTCSQPDCVQGFIARNIISGSVFASSSTVPEPGSLMLLGLGLGLAGLQLGSKRKK